MLLTFVIIVCCAYALLLLYYRHAWGALTRATTLNFGTAGKKQDNLVARNPTHFSIIIPARNEAANIYNCVNSILQQNYPAALFEIIVIDDFSEDETALIVAEMRHEAVRLLKLSDFINGEDKVFAHKKKALEIAIEHAKGNWIVTTDADCIIPPTWLTTISNAIREQGADFIAGPVRYQPDHSFIAIFQTLDFLSLQGITGAAAFKKAHVLCNGANLAYNKAMFYRLEGFKGIDHIKSGDDMLLMQKFYNNRKEGITYLLNEGAIVTTFPMPTWKSFLHQRMRWASKTSNYNDPVIYSVLLLVYAVNVSLFLLALYALFIPGYGLYLLALLALKTVAELYFLLPVTKFFKQSALLWYFVPAQPFHILYTILAGWLGKFRGYSWKGRTSV